MDAPDGMIALSRSREIDWGSTNTTVRGIPDDGAAAGAAAAVTGEACTFDSRAAFSATEGLFESESGTGAAAADTAGAGIFARGIDTRYRQMRLHVRESPGTGTTLLSPGVVGTTWGRVNGRKTVAMF